MIFFQAVQCGFRFNNTMNVTSYLWKYIMFQYFQTLAAQGNVLSS